MLMSPHYEFERSIVIKASPDAIHAWVGELRKWPEWVPWETTDNNFAEKTSGVGGSYRWSAEGGDGELTFSAWDAAEGVVYDMAFLGSEAPMKSNGSITYAEEEAGTRVKWRMRGKMDGAILGGWHAAGMDRMVGPMFDLGLAELKRKVEGTESK
jgi:hypothetical protein